jgi:hypothetical protein
LLPELESPEVADAAASVRRAIAALSFDDVDVIVLLTPHASKAGVYRQVRGHLGSFGLPDIAVAAPTNDEVIGAIGSPLLDEGADHGVVVPLRLGRWSQPVVAVGVAGGERLAFESEERVAVVASVNGSAGISARAPLTAVPGADVAERRFADAVQNDLRSVASIELPGSCGSDVLATFAEVFDGRRAKVLAHEVPVGVGYLVAEVR